MSKQPEHIHSVYQHSDALKKLMQRTKLLEHLNHLLQSNLPAQFSAHCRLANIKNGTLIIHTDNASYASLIRFQAPQLCKTLSTELEMTITGMDIKVRPLHHISQNEVANSLTLSQPSASLLQQTADCIEEGPLKAALEKLARRCT